MEIEPGGCGCGVYSGIRGLGVSMNRRNERRVTIVDRSGGRVDQTVTLSPFREVANPGPNLPKPKQIPDRPEINRSTHTELFE
jgi:hypothetical protein